MISASNPSSNSSFIKLVHIVLGKGTAGQLEQCPDLFQPNRRKILHKIFDGNAFFEVPKKALDRDPCVREDGRTAHDFGVDGDEFSKLHGFYLINPDAKIVQRFKKAQN